MQIEKLRTPNFSSCKISFYFLLIRVHPRKSVATILPQIQMRHGPATHAALFVDLQPCPLVA
jgi:hypothetical protein